MDINEKLQQAGLTGNETKVYLELTKKGQLTANQIAKNLGMDRTLTYTILNHLIEKGQVNYIVRENKKTFSCSNPESLLNPIKAKESLIEELIKELGKIKRTEQQQTEIKVYEGKEGIRTLISHALKEKEFCSFGSTG
ncbi:MAG: winged helix-turn-helix transcriptional regulator, partial [Nanoarchaeota archaeon]|nr:winged helix-turn-helix transcriptional regulator [Nanoarchaeota archaeon]